MKTWIFVATTLLSTAAYSQTNTAPSPVGINTEPGYVAPRSPGIGAASSAAGAMSSSTPGTLGTSQLGDGLDTSSMGSDLSRLFDPILPPGVGTGTAAPGGSQNPTIPGR